MTFNEIEQAVLEWANDRKIITLDNHRQMYMQVLRTQCLKLTEELGELYKALWGRNHLGVRNEAELIDAIGDSLVVMTSIAWALPMQDKSLTDMYEIVVKDQHQYEDIPLLIGARIGDLSASIIKNKPSSDICNNLNSILLYLFKLAEDKGLYLVECYEAAYNVIKDRKGKTTTDGNFIKEGD